MGAKENKNFNGDSSSEMEGISFSFSFFFNSLKYKQENNKGSVLICIFRKKIKLFNYQFPSRPHKTFNFKGISISFAWYI